MFCEKCGTKLPDTADFCPKCGFDRAGGVQQQRKI